MIYGILLAAGLGRRIGSPKALLTLDGETFHQRAVRSFAEAGLPTIVITNPQIESALASAQKDERRITNPDPDRESGMFASVLLGVAEALDLGATGAVLLPVDHPLVGSDDIRVVRALLETGASVVVATHGGRRGHPVGISRTVMGEIAFDPSLATLRDIVRRDAGRVVEAPISEGAVLGVNTKEDLERVSNRTFR